MTTSILQLFECLKTCEWFVKLEDRLKVGQIKKCIFSDMFLIHLPFLVAYLTFEIIIKGLGSEVFCSCSFQKRTPEVYLKVFSIFFCCSFFCFCFFFLVVLSGFFSSVQFSVVLSFLIERAQHPPLWAVVSSLLHRVLMWKVFEYPFEGLCHHYVMV